MKHQPKILSAAALSLGLLATSAFQSAQALPIRAGFDANTLAPNDDGSTGLVGFGFTLDYFGTSYSGGFVNNNGNVTLDAPLGTFTPFPLLTTSTPMFAPFFADVDTRAAGSPVTYGTGVVMGQDAFGVNWVDVDYFSSDPTHTNRNSFQLVLIDRSDIAAGDFDIEFNYEQIQWEAGQASGGDADGLGGSSARVGWSDGVANAYELAGSAINGAFLDGGPNALISNSLNSGIDGRYIFNVRSGQVQPPQPQPNPAPATLALLGLGLGGLGLRRRKT